ncbi:hypothetical protein IV102_16875 [bacterium]|nr:hypothetical protein [bacterium]
MDPLESRDDVRAWLQDVSLLAGVDPTRRDWLREEDVPTTELRSQADIQQLLSSLLVRLIGMEVSLS